MIQHPKEVISLTANEIGKRSDTSGAAVIRLCKSLGLKGLPDLKLRIAGDLQKTKESGLRDIEPNESAASIIDKMTTNTIQTIQETAELLDTHQLEKAVQTLRKARKIHFFWNRCFEHHCSRRHAKIAPHRQDRTRLFRPSYGSNTRFYRR